MENLYLPQRVEAEIKKIVAESYITPEFLHSMEVDEAVTGEFAETLAVRVCLTLMGRVVNTESEESQFIDKTEEIDYYHHPCTWWDGFKFELVSSKWFGWLFPANALNNWINYKTIPKTHNFVTHEKREIRHYHMCPFPAGANYRDFVQFLQWSQPFSGTQKEYLLLRMMALACVNMLHQNNNLMLQMPEKFLKIISEYLHEITRQTAAHSST